MGITSVWIGFILLVIFLLSLDLGLLNRKDHVISTKEAFAWTGFWVVLALSFGVLVYFIYANHWFGMGLVVGDTPKSGRTAALEYLTGYIIEESLSLDNIFIIALILKFFRVPREYQHRVLFWGIVGALIMRGIMIGAGVVLINKFSWMIYVFGGLLIVSAIKMLFSSEEKPDLEHSRLVRWVRKLYPISPTFDGHAFFTRMDGKRAATPLFLALILVEFSDVIFAVDSIPAIFAVTRDPFIVFTSNIFAILGLRSLYFVLAQLLHSFHYLKISLIIILFYVGAKMMLSHFFHIPAWISLLLIVSVLGIGVVASIIRARHLVSKCS